MKTVTLNIVIQGSMEKALEDIRTTSELNEKYENIILRNEIRYDLIKEPVLKKLVNTCKRYNLQSILTNTKAAEGPLEKYKDILQEAMDIGADFVTIEKKVYKKVVPFIEVQEDTIKIISYHKSEGRLSMNGLVNVYEEMKQLGPIEDSIIKIGFKGEKDEDALNLFDLILNAKKENTKIIGIVMGNPFLYSRPISLILGNESMYAVLSEEDAVVGDVRLLTVDNFFQTLTQIRFF